MTSHEKLSEFHGGLILQQHKRVSTQNDIQAVSIPDQLVIPLQQNIGLAAQAIVSPGDLVKKGQVLAQAQGFISAAIHAPTSGKILDISKQATLHASGMLDWCITLEADHKDEWTELVRHSQYSQLNPEQLTHIIQQAGVVGLGGATFPSHIKLTADSNYKIEHLIINAAECEPWITCDDSLIREHAADILQGMQIIMHILQIERCTIALEDDMSIAKANLNHAIQTGEISGIEVASVPVIYPTGGEKQLIKVLTGQEVPSDGLPRDLRIVCHNVGTVYAIYRAVILGQPVISRIVTVTGEGVKKPANIETLIGTSINFMLEKQNATLDKQHTLIIGGPMMGFEVASGQLPVTKACNCLLLNKTVAEQEAYPCIRCGACAEVCPANLLPQQLFWYAQAQEFDRIQDYKLFDCIECGCCSYVCPSQIPLVQYYRYAKTEIWKQDKEKRKSDIARERHDVRNERLARQKKELEDRRRRKKEALRKSKGEHKAEDPKKAAIQAALERVRNKQQSNPVNQKNTVNLNKEQQSAIDEADKRRKNINEEETHD